MSYFEFRVWMESLVPWWTPFVVPALAYVVWIASKRLHAKATGDGR